MPVNRAKLSPDELEEYREYLARKKRESRERKKQAGLCTGCGVNKAKKNGVTCVECDQKSVEYERENGWRARPYKEVRSLSRKLRREGKTLDQILKHKKVKEYGANRRQISAWLDEAGLLYS